MHGIVDLASENAEGRQQWRDLRRVGALEARIRTAVLEGKDCGAAKAIFSNGFIVVSRAVRLLGPFIT